MSKALAYRLRKVAARTSPQDSDHDLLVEAAEALEASRPVEAAPSDTDDGVWTCGHCGGGSVNPDAMTGNTHVYEAVWKPSQPVRVEVTEDMVERAAVAIAVATGWEPDAVLHNDRRIARAVLDAALGGGDHAE